MTGSFRYRFALLCLCISWVTGPVFAATVDPADFFDQSLGDFSEELDTARESGKTGVLLFFEQEECPFCARMRATVFNQSEVQDYFHERFLIFSVDIEGDLEIVDFQGNPLTEKAFASRNRVRATPVCAFFDLDGKPVVRYTGATSGKDEFLWLGEFAAEGIYRDMRFTRYKRDRRKRQKAP